MRKRNSNGRFAKSQIGDINPEFEEGFKSDTTSFVNLFYMIWRFLPFILLLYILWSYFRISSKLQEALVEILCGPDCKCLCKPKGANAQEAVANTTNAAGIKPVF